MKLHLQIIDENCAEGECWAHYVDIGTSKVDILAAIAIFYPTATSILMEMEEE